MLHLRGRLGVRMAGRGGNKGLEPRARGPRRRLTNHICHLSSTKCNMKIGMNGEMSTCIVQSQSQSQSQSPSPLPSQSHLQSHSQSHSQAERLGGGLAVFPVCCGISCQANFLWVLLFGWDRVALP